MTFTNPAGLWFLTSLIAVLAIHLFQRRFRRKTVTGLFLWREARAFSTAGKKIKPPPPTASLFLELFACVLLSFLLAGASCRRSVGARSCAVVLDGSASMSAVSSDGISFKEKAAERLRNIIGRTGVRVVTVLASGPSPRLLLGPDEPVSALPEAISAWNPELPDHDLSPAVNLARTLAGPGKTVYVLTDQLPHGSPPAGVHWIAVGESRPNVAFVGASRSRYDSARDLVRVTVAFFGKAGPVSMTFREGTRTLHESVLSGPGEKEIRITVPRETGLIEASLPPDALDLENRAYLPPPLQRTVRCAVSLKDPLEARLLKRALKAVGGTRLVSGPPADLYVVAGIDIPRTPPGSWICAFSPFKKGEPEAKSSYLGPYTTDARHPLLESVSLRGVMWNAPSRLPASTSPLVSCGKRVLLAEAPPPYHGFLFNLALGAF